MEGRGRLGRLTAVRVRYEGPRRWVVEAVDEDGDVVMSWTCPHEEEAQQMRLIWESRLQSCES